MSPLNTAEIITSGICLTVGLLHLTIYLRRRELTANLFFAVMSLCTAVSAMLDAVLFRTGSLGGFMPLFKWQVSVQGAFWISLTWFIVFYAGAGRRWLAWTVTGLYAAAVLINIASPDSVLFSEVHPLQFTELPWGEQIAFVTGEANPLRIVADIAWFLMLWLTMEGCVGFYRKGQRSRAAVFGCGLFASAGIAYLHGTLIDIGVVSPPPMFSFAFLILIMIMSAALTGEVIRASELALEVAANERRWRSLMENIQLLAAGVDRHKKITYVNPWFLSVTGFSREELIGRRFLELISESDRGPALERFQRALNGRVRSHTRITLVKKDGSEARIAWSNVALQDAGGSVVGLMSIGQDVTALEAAEKALRDEKARMDVILSTLDTGLALMDGELNVLWVNDTFRAMYPWADPVGEKCHLFAENRDAPCEGCGAVKVFADGQIHQRDLQNSRNHRWYQIVSLPIRGGNGRIVNVLESVTDITGQKATAVARDQALAELREMKESLESENVVLKELIQTDHGFEEIVGESNAMRYVLSKTQQVGETDAVVLIQGETGTGKGLLAEAVHQAGDRAKAPFVTVNCAAIPEALIESELFGHEQGAFTGATQLRRGRFELADGGTLFLDEIGELPMALQAKLLGVLQDGRFERVGGSRTISSDVRIIAATNRDLPEDVAAGRFRADLFYRLNVYPITIPPLRQRCEDIPLLVKYFVSIFARKGRKIIDQVPQLIMDALIAYDWPGNVRELRNVIERAVITSPGPILALPGDFRQNNTVSASNETPAGDEPFLPLEEAERRHILKALKSVSWRISGPTGAAKLLNMNPSTLRNRMKKHGLKRP